MCLVDIEGGRVGRGRGVSGVRRVGGLFMVSLGGFKLGFGFICIRLFFGEVVKSVVVGSGGGFGLGILFCLFGFLELVWFFFR